WVLTRGSNSHALRCNAVPVEAPPNQEFVKQGSTDSQNLHVKGAQSVASWSLFLAGLVVGITVCVAIGYIVFLQPNPDSNVPNLPPSDAMVETPPDETSSTSSPSQTRGSSEGPCCGELSREWQIVLQKSFCTGDQKFSGL